MQTETQLKILRHIQANPGASQRKLAQELGVSLGKINYCMRALIAKGCIKAGNFKRNVNKSHYLYLLTTKGIEEKANLTAKFLKIKISEYEKIAKDIEQYKREY